VAVLLREQPQYSSNNPERIPSDDLDYPLHQRRGHVDAGPVRRRNHGAHERAAGYRSWPDRQSYPVVITMGQQQIQKKVQKPTRKDAPADAPTVSKKIAKLWFREDNS
jgi:hypothetical protein